MRWLAGVVLTIALTAASPTLTRAQINQAKVKANLREVAALKAFVDRHPAFIRHRDVCRQDAQAAYYKAFDIDGSVYRDLEQATDAIDLGEMVEDRTDYMISWQQRCMADVARKEASL